MRATMWVVWFVVGLWVTSWLDHGHPPTWPGILGMLAGWAAMDFLWWQWQRHKAADHAGTTPVPDDVG